MNRAEGRGEIKNTHTHTRVSYTSNLSYFLVVLWRTMKLVIFQTIRELRVARVLGTVLGDLEGAEVSKLNDSGLIV